MVTRSLMVSRKIEEHGKQMALYSYQQGIAYRQFTPEEIFPSSVSTKVII